MTLRVFEDTGIKRGDATFSKAPDEILDFTIQYQLSNAAGDYLFRNSADTISSSTWIVPAGITQTKAQNTGLSTTIWLSGGSLGNTYELVNKITTTGGRTKQRTIRVRIKNS
jgi:hypothetical protein